MPCHFGGWAGLGIAMPTSTSPARRLKRTKAVAINPHLDCIKQAVSELRKQVL